VQKIKIKTLPLTFLGEKSLTQPMAALKTSPQGLGWIGSGRLVTFCLCFSNALFITLYLFIYFLDKLLFY
jgi:hypothetical protein